MQAEIGEKI